MKKYIRPEMNIILLNVEHMILAGSEKFSVNPDKNTPTYGSAPDGDEAVGF
ncbi:MAG: hypothetical protein HUK08_06520 [Bacteroidaceae bacterium]|nr:hypothetical protein [Bacteroidaceae bacterium]